MSKVAELMTMPRGGARPGAGRKALAGVRLTKAIRFSAQEWAQVEQQAKRSGITASEYVRLAVLKWGNSSHDRSG
jgi:hypothetical protein